MATVKNHSETPQFSIKHLAAFTMIHPKMLSQQNHLTASELCFKEQIPSWSKCSWNELKHRQLLSEKHLFRHPTVLMLPAALVLQKDAGMDVRPRPSPKKV